MKRKDKKMLEACRGEFCYLRIPNICIGGTETVVPAHSNEFVHGKGMSIKAYDHYTVPACYMCHAEIDQGKNFTKDEKKTIWREAFKKWLPVREKKLNAKSAAVKQADTKKAGVNGASTPRPAAINR